MPNKLMYAIAYSNFKTPQVGFEPTTNRLTVDRSATELLRIAALAICNISGNKNKWQGICKRNFQLTDLPNIRDMLVKK